MTFKKVEDVEFKTKRFEGATEFMRLLEVGHGFECNNDTRKGVYQIAKNLGFKIKTKKLKNGNIFVWRIS